MEPSRPQPLASRLQGFGTTIFTEMTALAQAHDAVNLGQGFPDFDGPPAVLDGAIEAIRAGHNQYGRLQGVPDLNRAVAEHQERHYGLRYDADAEVTAFAGATEAIHGALLALCEPGDEVIVLEPCYDCYRPAIAMADAVAVAVHLAPPRFQVDAAAIEAAVTPRTRAILLNSPLNPTGTVLSRAELEGIADICRRHDLLAITDEVYEHLVYDVEHVPIATLPGMRERTVTISSAGKTFSVTGWKVGWACANAPVADALRSAKQFTTFCSGTPLQLAVAAGLRLGDAFLAGLAAEYRARRDRLCEGLERAGLDVLVPEGTYFVLADVRPLGFEDDMAFCRELPARAGVAAIPLSAFQREDPPRHLARFAFCKTDAVLDEGIRRLARLRG
ncbi:MAG: methionine aminotransferase [Thermoleophilia bacterium]